MKIVAIPYLMSKKKKKDLQTVFFDHSDVIEDYNASLTDKCMAAKRNGTVEVANEWDKSYAEDYVKQYRKLKKKNLTFIIS